MNRIRVGLLLAAFCVGTSSANAAILSQLSSPGQIAGGTTLNFDNLVAGSVANSAYLAQGVQFSRGDSGNILVFEWTSVVRSTTSPRNVMAAVSTGGGHSSFIDVIFSQPTIAVGAYMGNDVNMTISSFELELFDSGNVTLGTVQVVANKNRNVDQFVGVSSDTPFVRARFKNLPSDTLQAAVLDDVTFLTHSNVVPEPSTIAVWSVLCAVFAWMGFPRRRSCFG